MKIKSTVVNQNNTLIGFQIEGKASEFGEMGDSVSVRIISLEQMHKVKFQNNKAYFNGKAILEKNGFHINELPMFMWGGQPYGIIGEVDNTIALTERYMQDNENIGFGVQFGGHPEVNGEGTGMEVKSVIKNGRYKYDDVIRLTEIFKPVNFVIRQKSDGKQYIAGKSGSSLGGLPVVDMGDNIEGKRTKSSTTPVSVVTGGKLVNNLDIMDIFDFVEKYNGFIIKLPDTKYTATGETLTEASSRFTSLGIGEVGSAVLEFSETKLNANCKFKNPGVVNIDNQVEGPVFAGASTPVYSFIYRTKSLFSNGEHHLTRIGIIIPDEAVNELYETFNKSMSVKEITDGKTIDIINRLINWKHSKVFEVDTTKLALISHTKFKDYILDNCTIHRLVSVEALSKIALKYIRHEIKDLAEANFTGNSDKKVAPQFAGKTSDELEKLINSGINVFTGAFTEQGETVRNEAASGKEAIEIRYIIDGMDPKNFDYKKIMEKPEVCPSYITEYVKSVEAIADLQKRLDKLLEDEKHISKNEYYAKRKLWMHKTCSWLSGDKLGLKCEDPSLWELNMKKRTKADCYNCIDPKAPQLQILLTNTELLK